MSNSLTFFYCFAIGVLQGTKGGIVPQSAVPLFECANDGYYPMVPGTCSAGYMLCYNGVAYQQTCAGVNYVFDPVSKQCQPYNPSLCSSPSSAMDGSTTTTTTTRTTTTTTTNVTPTTTTSDSLMCPEVDEPVSGFVCPQPEGYFPPPGITCASYFFQCFQSVAHAMPCPSGLVWNSALNVCDWPRNIAGC